MPDRSAIEATKGRRHARRSPLRSWQSEPSQEMVRRAAFNRFSYSGGYDGYDGRMMLTPEAKAEARARPAAPDPMRRAEGGRGGEAER